jgi:hypothetical protein
MTIVKLADKNTIKQFGIITTFATFLFRPSMFGLAYVSVSYARTASSIYSARLAFIFGALLEFALVNYYGRMEFLRKEKKAKKFKDQNVNMLNPGLIAAPFAVDPPRKSLSPPSASPFVPADPQLDVGCPQCNDEAEQLHWKQQVNEPEVRLFGVVSSSTKNENKTRKTSSSGGHLGEYRQTWAWRGMGVYTLLKDLHTQLEVATPPNGKNVPMSGYRGYRGYRMRLAARG